MEKFDNSHPEMIKREFAHTIDSISRSRAGWRLSRRAGGNSFDQDREVLGGPFLAQTIGVNNRVLDFQQASEGLLRTWRS